MRLRTASLAFCLFGLLSFPMAFQGASEGGAQSPTMDASRQIATEKETPPKIVSEDVPVPEDLPEDLARRLEPGLELKVLRLWPVAETTESDQGTGELGIAFPNLAPGALLGVVEIREPWTDYADHRVPPGLYTLRYGVQPADGYHMGLTLYRDFALLVPLERDPGGPISIEDAIDASRRSSSGSHPGVMALVPLPDASDEASTDLRENDLGQPTLSVAIGSLRVGLVVSGTGDV